MRPGSALGAAVLSSSGNWTPLDFGDNLVLWLDGTLQDQSSYSNVVTAVNAPTQGDTAGPNGSRGWTLIGASSQYLRSDAVAAAAAGDDKPISVACTFECSTVGVLRAIWSFGVLAGAVQYMVMASGATSTFNFNRAAGSNLSAISAAPADILPHALVVVFKGTTVDVWLDGVRVLEGAPRNTPPLSVDTFVVGTWLSRTTGNPGDFLLGKIGQVIVVSRALTDSEAAQTSSFCDQRMGIARTTSCDLLMVAGQSNAEGRGNSSQSPTLSGGIAYYGTSGGISPLLGDPVGGANTGSMWPSFAQEWYARTGRGLIIVEQAVSGSALLAAAAESGGDWSPTGSLRGNAVTAWNAVLGHVASSNFVLENKYVVWCQGERDAQAVNGTTVTAPLYQAAFEELMEYFFTEIAIDNFVVVQTGAPNSDPSNANWASIRAAQSDAVDAVDGAIMGYAGAYLFPSLGYMADNLHWNQQGLNLAGTAAAEALSLVA